MKIDMELCKRFAATLPKQQIAMDDNAELVALTPHWISTMVTDALESENHSCEVLASFVKSNLPLIQMYATKMCEKYSEGEEVDKETLDLFIQEVSLIFAYYVMQFAHDEELNETLKKIATLEEELKKLKGEA